MRRSHIVIDASSWLATQALAGPVTGTPLDFRERTCGTVIAAAGALLCDLDTPTSRLAQSLGPVSRLAARTIGRVSGGHHVGTHSLAFCALVGALSALALSASRLVHVGAHVTRTVGQLVALAIAYLTVAPAVALLLHARGARGALITAAVVAAGAQMSPSPALWALSRRRVRLRVIRRSGDRRHRAGLRSRSPRAPHDPRPRTAPVRRRRGAARSSSLTRTPAQPGRPAPVSPTPMLPGDPTHPAPTGSRWSTAAGPAQSPGGRPRGWLVGRRSAPEQDRLAEAQGATAPGGWRGCLGPSRGCCQPAHADAARLLGASCALDPSRTPVLAAMPDRERDS
jgi:hypothetical protein